MSDGRVESAQKILRVSRVFGALEASSLAELGRSSRRSRHARGELLWRAGDEARELSVIASGVVKVAAPLRSGRASILGIFGPHESVGDAAVVRGRPYPADAVVATELAELLWIERGALLEAMLRDTTIAHAINQSLAEHNLALQSTIRILGAGQVENRLATLFLHLAERFGDELDDGDVMVPLALSRSDLASLVGTTPESATRVLSRWHKTGVILTEEAGFRIAAPDAIERLAAIDEA